MTAPATLGSAGEDAPAGPGRVLAAATDLHGSVSDPTLDALTFLNEITFRYPDAVSFAAGRPYDGWSEPDGGVADVRRYLDHLAAQGRTPAEVGYLMHQYGPTAGFVREAVAASLRVDEGMDVTADAIVVTVGAQEAMLLVLRALTPGPDDVLLVSSPCYVGVTGAARLLDVPVVVVPEREDGLAVADLEAAILAERARGRHPRACYVVPDHANPSGTTLPLPARHELLALAARHDVLVLEDTPYRLLSPDAPLPTLKALDRDRRVVHVGSYSKTVYPAARVGFVVADQPVRDARGHAGLLAAELVKLKSMVTLNTPALSQAVVAGALLACDGRLSRRNAEAAAHYGRTMRATLHRLDACLPADRRAALGVRWNEPAGGFFLRLRVPFVADDAALVRSADRFGVLWTPMAYFHPEGGGRHAIRLSTSYLTGAQIDDGIGRLAAFVEAECAERAA